MIIVIIWYIRKTQNTYVCGEKDCELQGYKEVSTNEDSRKCDEPETPTRQSVDDNFPINLNQEEGSIELPLNQTSSGEQFSPVEQSLCA